MPDKRTRSNSVSEEHDSHKRRRVSTIERRVERKAEYRDEEIIQAMKPFTQYKNISIRYQRMVFRAKHRNGEKAGQPVALKLLAKDPGNSHLQELKALQDLQGAPFVNQLQDHIHTSKYLVFVLDWAEGGDLQTLMDKRQADKPLTESEVRFYLCEVLEALDHVHRSAIVHHDLKAENVLVGEDGHIQLADFGLSYRVDLNDSAHNSIGLGTWEYLAPELLKTRWQINEPGYEYARDSYALGVLALKLANTMDFLPYGDLKKAGDEPWEVVRRSLIRGMKSGRVNTPRTLSPLLRDLVMLLLHRDVKERLGGLGAHYIKRHPFFKDVDWNEVKEKRLQPPQSPTCRRRE